jgi:hypothetical protein
MNEKTAQKIDEIVKKQKDALTDATNKKESGEIIVQVSINQGGITDCWMTKRDKLKI